MSSVYMSTNGTHKDTPAQKQAARAASRAAAFGG